MRIDGRSFDQLRAVEVDTDYVEYPEGSVLIHMGKTRVLCNATVTDGVPRWIYNQNLPGGWVTGEYAMLPRSTQQRTERETRGLGGRTQEIRRLIGRSLRASIDLQKLGSRTIIIDCDVLQADGGTRTAAITGGYIALALAVRRLVEQGLAPPEVIKAQVAAISAGMINGTPMLDLCYSEDSTAQVDVNVVMNHHGEFIEVQGTAEGAAFKRGQLDEMLALAEKGITELLEIQRQVLSR